MKYGTRVRVVNGEYKGKTATVIGPVPWSRSRDMVTARDVIPGGYVEYRVAIQLDDGQQTTLEEKDLELIED